MKKVAGWWLPDVDTYFGPILEAEGGFHYDRLFTALSYCTGPRRRAIDVGAHVGTWAVELARTFTAVEAYEPTDDTYTCLVKNTAAWSNLRTHNIALGAEEGWAVPHDDPARPGNTGSRYMTFSSSPPPATSAACRVATLDSYGWQDVDFLKIDVEGAEHLVLTGAIETLKCTSPVVLLEVKKGFEKRYGVRLGKAVDMLAALGAREVARVGSDRILHFRG